MELTDRQQEWQRVARRFAAEVLRPASLERDQIPDPAATFDWDIVRQGSALGFRTLALGRRWGGHEADMTTQALVMMELARGDSAMAKTFSQNWKWTGVIQDACSEEQQQRYLSGFATDDTFLLGAAKTEPQGGGSDGVRMPVDDPRAGWMMRAERDGDGWILNGTKHFIANGPVARLILVATRTDRTVRLRDGATLFAVWTDNPGFKVERVHDKTGWRFYQNGALVFTDCRVPDADRIGEVDDGFEARSRTSEGFGGIELAANAVGLCDAALDMALEHARTRRRGGMPLIDHQTVRLQLTEMDMLTEALRALTLRAAWEADHAKSVNNTAAMNLAAETLRRVTDLNMDIHGAASVQAALGAEKLVRDAAIWWHLASDSVQRMKGLRKVERKRAALQAY